MIQTLTIIRGLPGSGKSTLAKALTSMIPNTENYEADDWFILPDGSYKFDPHELTNAHAACLRHTEEALKLGSNVIVSNTFTTYKEMLPYASLATAYNAAFNIIECHGNFGSTHDVPAETISRMKVRWQPYIPD